MDARFGMRVTRCENPDTGSKIQDGKISNLVSRIAVLASRSRISHPVSRIRYHPLRIQMKIVLAVAAVSEAATGLALLAYPSIVVRLLLGAEIVGVGDVVSRFGGDRPDRSRGGLLAEWLPPPGASPNADLWDGRRAVPCLYRSQPRGRCAVVAGGCGPRAPHHSAPPRAVGKKMTIRGAKEIFNRRKQRMSFDKTSVFSVSSC